MLWITAKRKENTNKKQGTDIKREMFEVNKYHRKSNNVSEKLKSTNDIVKNTITIFKHWIKDEDLSTLPDKCAEIIMIS